MKIKLTMTVVYEYEPTIAHYPEGSSSEDILEIDRINAEGDPYMFMDVGHLTVTTEKV